MVQINVKMLMSRLQLLATLITFSGYVHAVQVTVKDSHLNGTEGGNVTLLCTFKTTHSDSTNLNIQWTFIPSHSKSNEQSSCPTAYVMDESSVMHCPKTVHIFDRRGLCSQQLEIYYSEGTMTYINPAFKGRLSAEHKPGNASITIEKLRTSDSGNYICEVDNPPDFQGNNIGSVILTVLVPPSKPECGIGPHPVKARSAILTCHSNEGDPSPTYHWVKIVHNIHQNISGNLDPRTGMLTISNISDTEYGIYQCTASNKLGNETCTVDLSKVSSENDSIIGGIVGAVLIALVIGVIIWVVAKKAKKAKKNAQKDNELQVKQESRTSPATYVAVPTDTAAMEHPNDAQLPDASQNSTEAPDVHQFPNESLPLNENAPPPGTEKAGNKESEGDGPQTT
ncbi:V-set and immunoglobulin domain-containing protein 1-like isoform X1 [Narcine bancroftii]|uniref:V-set and immunoglobulin domain-containing protein 1-like isoform X1 n=1 Tax=Narcine bancroftii TaxID=1343680 RepID=UPI003831C996